MVYSSFILFLNESVYTAPLTLFFILKSLTPEISGGGGLTETFDREAAPAVRFIDGLGIFYSLFQLFS